VRQLGEGRRLFPSFAPEPAFFARNTPDRATRSPYPGSARRQGIEGDVILQLSVDEAGKLMSVSVARGSGHRALDEAVIAAVKLWRFEPAVADGRPAAAVAELPVRFRLAGGIARPERPLIASVSAGEGHCERAVPTSSRRSALGREAVCPVSKLEWEKRTQLPCGPCAGRGNAAVLRPAGESQR
jgi:TonB family protein